MDRPATARSRTPAQRTGDAAEALAERRLTESGWTVLARNVHVGRHELDLVAIDPGPPRTLVAVEVRWRSRRDFGLPEETVDHRKRRMLRRAAFEMLERGRLPDGVALPRLELRFDLVVVEPGAAGSPAQVRHYRAAF
jgi:putative endonuclease